MSDISDNMPEFPFGDMSDDELEAFRKKRTEHLLKQARLDDFRRSCPPEFCSPIDRTRLPNLTAWDDADQWNCAYPGLWLWSHETGRGKSRMAWRLLGRAYCTQSKRYFATTGQHLAEIYFGFHMDGAPASFYAMIFRHDLVLVDDLDKCDVTDRRTGPMLREFFDEAQKRHAAVIITANEPVAYFESTLGPSAARRVRETCREIQF